MSKNVLLNICIIFLTGFSSEEVLSQVEYDTSDIVIRKISVANPSEYNISDLYIERDTVKNIYNIIMSLEIPSYTKLSLNVTDSAGDVIMILADNISLKEGIFRIRWEMSEIPPGRYWCEFITEKFIYRKDFFLLQ